MERHGSETYFEESASLVTKWALGERECTDFHLCTGLERVKAPAGALG